MFEDLKIIDSDTHWCEPLDIWTSRAPNKYKDLVPQVVTNSAGAQAWTFFGQPIHGFLNVPGSGSYVDSDGNKMPHMAWVRIANDQDMLSNTAPLDLVSQASWDPIARLELMDKQGIWAAISYPNILLFAMGYFVRCEDRDLANACISMYNDASAEFQAAGRERLLPMAVLPIWDVQASVKEAQRAKEMGFRGVVIPGEPQQGGLPDPSDTSWDPLYEALSDLELPINIHIGASVLGAGPSGGPPPPPGPNYRWKNPTMSDPRTGVAGSQLFGNNLAFVLNLVLSDLPLRFPKLRWVSVESGIGWIPHMLESIDFLYREEFPAYPDFPGPKLPNAHEMFKRSTYACFWFEKSAPTYLLDDTLVDNVMWETDFPHSTSLYPDPVERAAEYLKDVPAEKLKKIMQDNAAKLYNIPV